MFCLSKISIFQIPEFVSKQRRRQSQNPARGGLWMPDNRIPAAIRLPPGSENEIHRWTFQARNLTSPLNHCQPSHFFFSLQFQNFSLPNNRRSARFCAHPRSSIGKTSRTLSVHAEFVNPAKFQKERKLFAFSRCPCPIEEMDLGKN